MTGLWHAMSTALVMGQADLESERDCRNYLHTFGWNVAALEPEDIADIIAAAKREETLLADRFIRRKLAGVMP